MNPQQLLFSIIRNEILKDGTALDFWDELPNETLTELFVLASKHNLIHVVASNVIKRGVTVEDTIHEGLQKELMRAAYADWQREYALLEVCTVLNRAKISHIPLKGAVTCHYYPEAWMRNSCDVDVLIHPQDADRAIQALTDGGFLKEQDTAEHEYAFSAPNGFHLELHHVLTTHGSLPKTDALLGNVWEHTMPTEQDGYTLEMTGDRFLFYHVAHMAKHFIGGGCGIRPFIDLHLLQRRMPHDEKTLRALLSESELESFYDAASRLSSVWFDDGHEDELARQMTDYILSGGVYGSTENAAAVRISKGNSRISGFLRTAFLPRKNLEILYPSLKKHPLLLPFYQIRRWFRIFQRKKRTKIGRLIAAQATVSKETVSSTKTMFHALNLNREEHA